MARGNTIDIPKRIIKIAEWGAKYTYQQINCSLDDIETEANINALISLKNRGYDAEKNIKRDTTLILKATSESQVTIRQLSLQDIIASIYPEVKYEGRKLKDYEPNIRMNALIRLISGYKIISLNAYDKTKNMIYIPNFRTYIMATLPENDIHLKAANKLREYTQPFNTEKR